MFGSVSEMWNGKNGGDFLRMRKEKNRERGRKLQNVEKCLIQARTVWKSGRVNSIYCFVVKELGEVPGKV